MATSQDSHGAKQIAQGLPKDDQEWKQREADVHARTLAKAMLDLQVSL